MAQADRGNGHPIRGAMNEIHPLWFGHVLTFSVMQSEVKYALTDEPSTDALLYHGSRQRIFLLRVGTFILTSEELRDGPKTIYSGTK